MKQQVLVKLGQKIRQVRLTQSLSQEDLAALCGLHRTYIGGIECGNRNIGIVNLVKIASALKVSPGTLLENILFEDLK